MSGAGDQRDIGPVADEAAGMARPPRRVPRNYLAVGERRRLFWLVMPAGLALLLVLGWVERTWFPRDRPRASPQIDTRLEAVNGRPPQGDEVVIEREPEPLDEATVGLSASPVSLSRVRDATFFREADNDAWFETWNTLRDADAGLVRPLPPQDVGFSELFGQPRTFRGRRVRMRGTCHRLESLRAPANDYGIETYWQGWMEPAGGPSSPVVVQCLRLPEGMPTGMRIDEPVEVTGYFFKNYAYNASDTIRVAPLIMTLEPAWKPRPPASAPPLATHGGVTLVMLTTAAALALATWVGVRRGGRPSPGHRSPEPTGLDAALADVKPFSVHESLRDLAHESRLADPRPIPEEPLR